MVQVKMVVKEWDQLRQSKSIGFLWGHNRQIQSSGFCSEQGCYRHHHQCWQWGEKGVHVTRALLIQLVDMLRHMENKKLLSRKRVQFLHNAPSFFHSGVCVLLHVLLLFFNVLI
ncbi:hypothetical protein ABFX02_12G087400 [Erythranthe guttata]